jgi:hypothetical protein
LLNEEFCNLYSSLNIIRIMKARRIRRAWHGKVRSAQKIVVGKPEEKLLVRPRHKFEGNINMVLIGLGGPFAIMFAIGAKVSMLSGSTVTTAWRVLRLWIDETASKYGG